MESMTVSTESEKKPKRIPKNVLNIIRTTMRNNIELTHIADNKANVLLSLNALMLTFLLPMVVGNFNFVMSMKLWPALIVLIVTCLVTIYLSALSLKPGDFKKIEKEKGTDEFSSPFFFGNLYKLTELEFEQLIDEALSKDDVVRRHIIQDLYYLGTRLGEKMSIIRYAFNFFLTGLIVSVVIAAVTMLVANQ